MKQIYIILFPLLFFLPGQIHSQNVIACSSDFTMYSGNTGTENNFDSNTLPYTSCGTSGKDYEGADTIYQITATTSGFIYVVLTNMTEDLDILVYSGTSTCEALGRNYGLKDEYVCVKSDAGETYNILIDNRNDEVDVDFDLYVKCGYSIGIHDFTCDADLLGGQIEDLSFQCNLKVDGYLSSKHTCFQIEKYPECNSNSYHYNLGLKEDIYYMSLPSYLPDLKFVFESDKPVHPFFLICDHYDRAIILCNYEKKEIGYKTEYKFKHPGTSFPDDELFIIVDGKYATDYEFTVQSTKCSPPCQKKDSYCDDLLVSDDGDNDPHTFEFTAKNKYSSQIIRWEIPGVYDDFEHEKSVSVTLPKGTHQICYVYKDGYDHCEYKCCKTIHVEECEQTTSYCDDLLIYDKNDNDPNTFQFIALNKYSSQIIRWEIPGVYKDFEHQNKISVTLPEGKHKICYVYKNYNDHCEHKCCKTIEVKGCHKKLSYCDDLLVSDKGDGDPKTFQLTALNKYSSQIIRWEIPGTYEKYEHQNKISVKLSEGTHQVCYTYKDGYDHCEYTCCKTIEVKGCQKTNPYCDDILVYDKGDSDPGTYQFTALNKYSSQIIRWEIPGTYEKYEHQNKISVKLPEGTHQICYVYKDGYDQCEYKCCKTVYVKSCQETYTDCNDIWVLDKGDDDPHTFQFIALNKTLSQILRWEIPGSYNDYKHEYKVSVTLPEGTHTICYIYKDNYSNCEVRCCTTVTVAIAEMDPCPPGGLKYVKNIDGTYDFNSPAESTSDDCAYLYQITNTSTLGVATVEGNEGKDLKGYTFSSPGNYQVCAYSICLDDGEVVQSDFCCTSVTVEPCEYPQTGRPWVSNLGGYLFGTTVNLYKYDFSWDFYRADTVFNSQIIRTPYLTYSEAPEYFCLTTENGCGTTSYCADVACLNDNTLPYSIQYVFDEETGIAEFSFLQQNLPSDLTYTWEFGDDSTAETTGEFISHQYSEFGQYQVCCEISKPCDDDASDCCTIRLCRTVDIDTAVVEKSPPDFVFEERFQIISVEPELNVFPNPTSGLLQVQFNDYSDSGYTIELLNLYGQILKRIDVDARDKPVDHTFQLYDLNPGTYLLNIRTDRENYSRRVVLVN